MLESILAVFVLSIGIVGVMSLLVSSMKHSMDSRDTIIATELAQEGLELVRNVRDNNVASGLNSFDNLSSNFYCRMDYDDAFPSCSLSTTSANYTLKYNSNYYDHADGASTKFARRIALVNDANGIKVMSIVSWKNEYVDSSSCTVANKCVMAQAILVAR